MRFTEFWGSCTHRVGKGTDTEECGTHVVTCQGQRNPDAFTVVGDPQHDRATHCDQGQKDERNRLVLESVGRIATSKDEDCLHNTVRDVEQGSDLWFEAETLDESRSKRVGDVSAEVGDTNQRGKEVGLGVTKHLPHVYPFEDSGDCTSLVDSDSLYGLFSLVFVGEEFCLLKIGG